MGNHNQKVSQKHNVIEASRHENKQIDVKNLLDN